MNRFNATQSYNSIGVNTSNRGQLLVMLYDAAIKFSEKAKVAIQNKQYAIKGENIINVQSIIHELIASLNYDQAPDLCKNLEGLYMYMCEQLTNANINMKTQGLDNTIGLLKTLKEEGKSIV